jgi:hypothetical protein
MCLQRGVLAQDRLFELPQRVPRLDRKFFDQRPARVLEGFECLRLASAPIQSEHQLPSRALPERVLTDEKLELRNHLLVTTGGEARLDQFFARADPKLVEPRNRPLRERLIGEIGQRRTAPERQRLGQQGNRVLRAPRIQVRAPGLVKTFEAVRVELIRLELQQVARRSGVRRSPAAAKARRNRDTNTWTVWTALSGGCSSHISSIRRSTDTTWLGRIASTASTAR